jgi:NADH-quinone oxidoreductase subunit J
METAAFYILSVILVVTSLLVVAQRNPMYSVLLLITSFGALAGLYVILDAPFTAVTQIIIYAGAIMVLFLFVVMLLNVQHEPPSGRPMSGLPGPTAIKAAAVVSVLIGIELIWALTRIGSAGFRPEQAEEVSSVANIGHALFTRYGFAFEVTSILILVSMVGAVVLARREH